MIYIIVIEVLNAGIPWLPVNSFMGYPLWSVPLVTTLVFLLSFLVVRLMQTDTRGKTDRPLMHTPEPIGALNEIPFLLPITYCLA